MDGSVSSVTKQIIYGWTSLTEWSFVAEDSWMAQEGTTMLWSTMRRQVSEEPARRVYDCLYQCWGLSWFNWINLWLLKRLQVFSMQIYNLHSLLHLFFDVIYSLLWSHSPSGLFIVLTHIAFPSVIQSIHCQWSWAPSHRMGMLMCTAMMRMTWYSTPTWWNTWR